MAGKTLLFILAALILVTSAAAETYPALYWKMNETTGGTTASDTMEAYLLTSGGGNLNFSPGKLGNALNLTINGYVKNASISFAHGNIFGWMGWVQLAGANGAYYTFLSVGGYEAGGMSVQREGGANKIRVTVNGNTYWTTTSCTMLQGQWNHIAILTNSSGGLSKIYQNGSECAFTLTSGTSDFNSFSATDIIIGREEGAATQYTAGLFDDFRIYNSSFNTSDLATAYNSGSGAEFSTGGTPIYTISGLVLYASTPVEGSTVYVKRLLTNTTWYAYTNSTGQFQVTSLYNDGLYLVTVWQNNTPTYNPITKIINVTVADA